MNTCFDVANYFLKCQRLETGDLMSNMKIQKLVYYAQGVYLALKGEALFYEPLMAWEFGPVCESLYQEYKKYGNGAIPIPEDMNTYELFDKETRDILNMVYRHYGQYSAWKLSNLTHEEFPWINAHRRGGLEISHQDMKEFFITQLEDDDDH